MKDCKDVKIEIVLRWLIKKKPIKVGYGLGIKT